MPKFAAYNTVTGAIDHVRETSWENLAYASRPDGHEFVEYEGASEIDSASFYVRISGAEADMEDRPSFSIDDEIRLGIGETKSVGLPAGTAVSLQDQQGEITDGALELSADMAGTYEVTLSLWPYKSKTVKVVVS
ncbi:hypothetical protein ASG25_13340 [Rhizobium sp. Leaf384]|uniref:hypothetical protein n=1 Tax=unclassified Rhizobium TaxID=2613769 RepID=UPI000715A8AC|nr:MULTISPECIES: hypothetical protein [unclassified Rhizobium]KQS78074.1 hypothetical protein ASG58_06590 [Rhizobium sp. Leaf383]KQS79493.1 hypothetical protein ASG25_13340 [Rhizobium sp. Leaf384]